MGFTLSIKQIKPLKKEETRNKALVKFRWSKFENHILKKKRLLSPLSSLHRERLIMLVNKD